MEKLRNKTLKLKSKKSTNFLRPIVQPKTYIIISFPTTPGLECMMIKVAMFGVIIKEI
jgi:hypothetical protein